MPHAPIGTRIAPVLGSLGARTPPTRFLSNGRYTTLVTGAGTGFSAVDDVALTAWRADPVEDPDGFFIYLRDLDSGVHWSAGGQPVPHPDARSRASWRPGVVELGRDAEEIESALEICVVPHESMEVRRLTLTNHSARRRAIEVTSYAEIVLAHADVHAAHPAFSKLFLQTELVFGRPALLAKRRPREKGQRLPVAFHCLGLEGNATFPEELAREALLRGKTPGRSIQWETDRGRFLGRCGLAAIPAALHGLHPLSRTTGNVLDPILCLRVTLDLEPGQRLSVPFVLGAGATREEASDLVELAAGGLDWDEVFAQAEAHERERIGRIGLSEVDAEYAQALAGAILYGDTRLRGAGTTAGPTWTAGHSDGRSAGRMTGRLEDAGLSAQRSFALLGAGAAPTAAAALGNAWRYWRALGLPIDLAVLAGESASRNPGATDHGVLPAAIRDADGFRLLREAELTDDLRRTIEAHADLSVTGDLPDLDGSSEAAVGSETGGAQGVATSADTNPEAPRPWPSFGTGPAPVTEEQGPGGGEGDEGVERDAGVERGGTDQGETRGDLPDREGAQQLRFFNGYGGFRADGPEYVIRLPRRGGATIVPPRPWINVIANESFGFLVSETGAGYTWSRNSREHRLTPWSNDPLLDPPGETFHVRDDDYEAFWSPFPGPTPASTDYETTHGFGTTVCRSRVDDLEQEILQFVPRDAPVKISRLRLTNHGGRPRALSVFSFARLVLGVIPERDGRFVETEYDPDSRTLFARNAMAGDHADGVTFAAAVLAQGRGSKARLPGARYHVTGDRAAFLGRGRTAADPVAVACGGDLDGRTGKGLDPCAAQQVILELAPGETAEISFLLGEETSREAALATRQRFGNAGAIAEALEEIRKFWSDGLSTVKISTPSPGLDLLVNGWLPYQTLACRVWGRSALYQSGGAFGFRDQLQDVSSLVNHWPGLAREHILRSAGHQFVEGDVLHWWHPSPARGLRTRFADDLLWLPLITSHYVGTTGDTAILDESAPFLTARDLAPGEDEAFLFPEPSGESASLYEHCCRAIERSLGLGEHGLPLFGTGDWNDGMNRVGREGKGESVWMAFFLDMVLAEFTPFCEARGDPERARKYEAHREALRRGANDAGWDGRWYRRGYHDDGTPLGSSGNAECRIDALVQAWSVLSGAAPPERAERAMDRVEEHLISEADGIIRLLTPPFDESPNDPGYIQGYVPGIRENGGQYTHAALWVVRAMAELGRNDRVAALLEMMSPVSQARAEHVATYQVEPYVVAADIYGAAPHVGRGGWTWYTGSSGWMERVALESLLGFRVVGGDTLVIRPCIPDDWPEFRIDYRAPDGGGSCEIKVINPDRCARVVAKAAIDGAPAPIEAGAARIPLPRDGRTHQVEIVLSDGPDTVAEG